MTDNQQPPADMVEAVRTALISIIFEEAQPDRGDVFSWFDDRAGMIAKAAIAAMQPHIEAEKAKAVAAERERCAELWMLLDDIDTLDDAAKGDDHAFRDRCYEIQQKRHAIMSGDHIDAIRGDAT